MIQESSKLYFRRACSQDKSTEAAVIIRVFFVPNYALQIRGTIFASEKKNEGLLLYENLSVYPKHGSVTKIMHTVQRPRRSRMVQMKKRINCAVYIVSDIP